MREPEFYPPLREFDPPGASPLPEEIASPAAESLPPEQQALPSEFAAPGQGGESAVRDEKSSFTLSSLFTASIAVALVATVTSLFFGSPIVSGAPAISSSVYGGVLPTPGVTETVDNVETEETEPPDPYAVTAFPALPNQDPDFAGDYAWAGSGTEQSEEFLIVAEGGETTFLVAGGYYRNGGIAESVLPGCSYDRESNTLTLSNFNRPSATIQTNLMGNGFKILLVGDNHLGQIVSWGAMYGGSITFTGTGSLTLNESQTVDAGLLIQAEGSPSVIMVDSGVILELFGTKAAYANLDCTLSDTLYFLVPLHLHGGVPGRGSFDENGTFTASDQASISTVLDKDSGQPAKHVIISAAPAE